MNEQDFIHTINEKTKNLTIPESVSPSEMKKRLDLAVTDKKERQTENTSKITAFNRNIRRATVAACIMLCLIGTVGITKLVTWRSGRDMAPAMNEAADDAMAVDGGGKDMAEVYEEDVDTEAAGEASSTEEYVTPTGLVTPKDYKEYYNDVKTVLDEYYDYISTVSKEYTNIAEDSNEEVLTAEGFREDIVTGAEKQTNSFNTEAAAADLDDIKAPVKEDYTASEAQKENDHSDTNKQEANVDEGDIIKTDGNYIYKVSKVYNNTTQRFSNILTITRAEEGKLTLSSKVSLSDGNDNTEREVTEFYLQGNTLFLLCFEVDDIDWNKRQTIIEIYDISDKENPKKTKELSQSGMLLSSRISDGYLYTVSNYTTLDFSTKLPYEHYIPCVNGKTIACDRIYYSKGDMVDSSKVITSLKLTNTSAFADTLTIPGSSANMYMSEKAMYFYEASYDDVSMYNNYDIAEMAPNVTKTKISKVYYDKGKFTVGESSVIAGYLYGPFAINEYNDHLRIVATIPANTFSLLRTDTVDFKSDSAARGKSVRIDEDVNVLYVLDDKMNLTGKIAGIAPGEIIYSARFMGDIGYFVTYRNTDPLFSVDLSDPANPELIGSLKIPGFSNYLHFYGKDILLGIGQETDPETGQNLGLKLSMFDVSDPSNVKEKDKHIIKDASYSNALYDYKEIMIDPEKNLFGFAYWNFSSDNDRYYYSTYTYDEKYGFVETASYRLPDDMEFNDAARGLYIGEYFYLTADTWIRSYKIGSEEMIDSVKF